MGSVLHEGGVIDLTLDDEYDVIPCIDLTRDSESEAGTDGAVDDGQGCATQVDAAVTAESTQVAVSPPTAESTQVADPQPTANATCAAVSQPVVNTELTEQRHRCSLRRRRPPAVDGDSAATENGKRLKCDRSCAVKIIQGWVRSTDVRRGCALAEIRAIRSAEAFDASSKAWRRNKREPIDGMFRYKKKPRRKKRDY